MIQTQTAYEVVARKMVNRIIEQFHPDKIIVFGSLVRGQVGPDSDLDILVIMRVEGSCRQKANEIDEVLADRTVPVDIIVVTPEQYGGTYAVEHQGGVYGAIVPPPRHSQATNCGRPPGRF